MTHTAHTTRAGSTVGAALRVLAALCVAALTHGCGARKGPATAFPLVIGSKGHTSGKFNRPRGIAYSPQNQHLYIVDWDGRIQKFTTNGQFRASWIMPKIENGKPEDLCVARDGRILVADTHYSRIMEYTPDGKLLRSFGSFGKEPGQFIYPVGVCCDSGNHIYVSEYGENDRIQKFERDGTFIKSWGRFGSEPGEFQRPSGIDVTTNGLLFVADAVNHRIQVFDLEGGLVRIIGKEGAEPGAFRYPYDVAVRGEDLFVVEFGNQRVQKLALDGTPRAVLGAAELGANTFACPWRLEIAGEAVFVSDTDNSRVVKVEL